MIFNTTGYIRDDFAVAGISWTPCYVLLGKAGPVLFESGFSYAGKLYEDDIQRFATGSGIAGNSEPEYLFLTHVHYDHCGATSYLKQKFSALKVAVQHDYYRLHHHHHHPTKTKTITTTTRTTTKRITTTSTTATTKPR